LALDLDRPLAESEVLEDAHEEKIALIDIAKRRNVALCHQAHMEPVPRYLDFRDQVEDAIEETTGELLEPRARPRTLHPIDDVNHGRTVHRLPELLEKLRRFLEVAIDQEHERSARPESIAGWGPKSRDSSITRRCGSCCRSSSASVRDSSDEPSSTKISS